MHVGAWSYIYIYIYIYISDQMGGKLQIKRVQVTGH